jgi:hypothetical protein
VDGNGCLFFHLLRIELALISLKELKKIIVGEVKFRKAVFILPLYF